MLRIDESELRRIFEKSPIGIAIVGLDGTFLHMNRAYCRLLEYTPAELVGKKFQQVTHPEDIEPDVAMVESLVAGKANDYTMHKRYISKTGKVVWVTLSVHVERDQSGTCEHFVAQVVPFVPADKAVVRKANGEQEAISLSPKDGDSVVEAVRKHWKWTLSMVTVVFSAIITFGVNYKLQEVRIEQNEKVIAELIETVRSLKNKENR